MEVELGTTDNPEAYDVASFITNYHDKMCWNLTKPYLKDQSEELINWLYDLINK